MSFDPYAPDTPPTKDQGPVEEDPRPWEVGEVVSLGWERFQAKWPLLVFTYVPMTVSLIAMQHVADILVWRRVLSPNSPASMATEAASILLAQIAGAFLQVGFLRIALDVVRERPVGFGTFFSGGGRMWPMFATDILVGLATLGGFLLLIVPGVVIAIGMALAPYYVVDADLGPVEAMKASWAATRGQKGDLFVLFVVGVCLSLLGILLLGVGLAATGPTFALAQAIVFTRMSGRGVVVRHESLAPPPGWPLVS